MADTKTLLLFIVSSLFLGLIIPLKLVANSNQIRTSIFLSDVEKNMLKNAHSNSQTASLLSAIELRVKKRAGSLSFSNPTTTNQWWHHASEYLTDAALIHAIRPTEQIGAWLRASVLGIVRRPVNDWAGPPFRAYSGGDLIGTLETAHLAWGVGIAFDLGYDLFTDAERYEIKKTLHEKALLPCRRFLEQTNRYYNWNNVLLAGYAVSAAILEDEDALKFVEVWLPFAYDHFQKDGSYGESLQYANYSAYSLMLVQETLIRIGRANSVSYEPYARMVNWSSHAFFYRKPMSGWPLMDWPRSANFGDSGSNFRPSGDLLIHIAVRAQKDLPLQAGIARWLFNTLYFPVNEPGPHDLASFGFVPDFGFLSVIMLANSSPEISPEKANLPLTTSYSCGDAFARDSWGGKTILAARLPGEARHAEAHLHGDVNSFILVHNKERLIVEAGHSCYRNIWRDLEVSSFTHNTCTFEVVDSTGKAIQILSQKIGEDRHMLHLNGLPRATEPVFHGGQQLIAMREGVVSVIGSDAAHFYGTPLRKFNRFWVLCGSNALFIIDQIYSEKPIRTTWNFLLNNRDGGLDLTYGFQSRIARRGDAGVMVTHYGGGTSETRNALMHDAYHPLPAQRGEGRPGSAVMIHWKENAPSMTRTIVHTIAVDSHAAVLGWESISEQNIYTLKNKDSNQKWSLQISEDGSFKIIDNVLGESYFVSEIKSGVWMLKAISNSRRKTK